jgi:hypothetical protein
MSQLERAARLAAGLVLSAAPLAPPACVAGEDGEPAARTSRAQRSGAAALTQASWDRGDRVVPSAFVTTATGRPLRLSPRPVAGSNLWTVGERSLKVERVPVHAVLRTLIAGPTRTCGVTRGATHSSRRASAAFLAASTSASMLRGPLPRSA